MLETLQKVRYTLHNVKIEGGRRALNGEHSINRAGYLEESYHYFHLRDSAGQELDYHFHEFDKLVILIEGRVDYLVEDRSYALAPWTVLLVRHHTIHKAVIDRSEPYERIILYLDPGYFGRAMPGAGLLDCFDQADKHGRHLLRANEEQLAELKGTIAAYEKAAQDTRFGARAMCETLIVQLLIHVSRLSEAEPAGLKGGGDPKIRQALSYINENFRSELTVDDLAERVFMSRYHFMRLFKEQTGSTVHATIRQKRLMHAARLIREGVPAVKAAELSGFNDYSAFHRAFKASFGISPGMIMK